MNKQELKQGKYYCSCGCGCLKVDYDQAYKKAQALQKQMGGKWSIQMYDSVGWKSIIYLGPIQVGACVDNKHYWARVVLSPDVLLSTETATTPQHAVRKIIKNIENITNRLLITITLGSLSLKNSPEKVFIKLLKQANKDIKALVKISNETNNTQKEL